MECECCNRVEHLIAVASTAFDVARFMELGVKVLLEIVLILEAPAALGTVVVRLAVVFLEVRITIEYLCFTSQFCESGEGENTTHLTA